VITGDYAGFQISGFGEREIRYLERFQKEIVFDLLLIALICSIVDIILLISTIDYAPKCL
jgi:hypothetical protein